jgi:hypothetical protein
MSVTVNNGFLDALFRLIPVIIEQHQVDFTSSMEYWDGRLVLKDNGFCWGLRGRLAMGLLLSIARHATEFPKYFLSEGNKSRSLKFL